MRVRHLMTPAPSTCRLDTPLDEISRLMNEGQCGTLIVLDHRGCPVGILTDRDLALEIGKTSRHPSEVPAADSMTSPMYTCSPDDGVRDALERMAAARVRRLPVLDTDGSLVGIVSIDDVVLWGARHRGVPRPELIRALRSICAAHDRLVRSTTLEDEIASVPPRE